MTDALSFSVDNDGIALIVLDLPQANMNVLNNDVMDALANAIDRICDDDEIIGAVFASGKKDFLAGADLRMIQDMIAQGEQLGAAGLLPEATRFNRILRKLETGGHSSKALSKGEVGAKPIAAAINGRCLGGGFEIALACHARFATPDSEMGLPEVKVGLLPGAGGTQRLPRMIGLQKGIELITSGRSISASEAVELGVISGTNDREALVQTAKAWVKESGPVSQPWDQRGFKFPGGAGGLDPRAAMVFTGANAFALRQTRGGVDNVRAILSAIYEGSALPIESALRVEGKYFTKLLLGGQSAAMVRTLFVNKLAAERGMRRPKGVVSTEIKKVGVLGAGLMGAGIAYASATSGLQVVLIDRDQESAEEGKAYSERLVERSVSKGRLSESAGDAILDAILPTTDYKNLQGCDIIIEAVFEDPGVKAEVIAKAQEVVGPDTVFGSNTSSLPISGLQSHWKKPENFIGIHFFSPVERMPLVEMILGEQTGDLALATAIDFVSKIRKTPIVVNDSRGFYTSRSVISYTKEAGHLLKEGVSPALIENSGRTAGYPMGPLQLADSTNIDLLVHVEEAALAALGEDYDAGPMLDVCRTMVDKHGRLGMKVSKGFYDYEQGKPKPVRLWPELSSVFPSDNDQPRADDVKDRLIYRQVLECVKCLQEGVLENPIEGDIGAVFGWAFPAHLGGPFSFIDMIGLDAFVSRCDELAERYGERFAAPELLLEMAKNGKKFHTAQVSAAAA